MSLILRAAALAVRAHEARVAGRVGILPGATEEMVAAAYLHDVLEDTAVTREEIEEVTNAQVAFYVDCVNHPRLKAGGF